MPVIVVIGALDTKHQEYAHLSARLKKHGCEVLLLDAGVRGSPGIPADIDRRAVAKAGGGDLDTLVADGDRCTGVDVMGRGAAEIVKQLHGEGRLDGVLALGGSGGTTIATQAMRALPLGVPKVMVSTMASGDTRPYVGASDITMTYPVVDIAGLNAVSLPVLDNAAAAVAAMAAVPRERPPDGRPLVAASMIGLTTPGVDALRHRLDELGFDTLVFHATGIGGRSLESLARDGAVAAVADLTPTELADDLAGGVCSAGPDRLTAAGARGIPQVVSLGGLDMVMFGHEKSMPRSYGSRVLHRHNASVTLMRTTAEECAELGRRMARKLNAARGPVTLFVPADGLSLLSETGQPFHDPVADQALVDVLLAALDDSVTVRRPGLRLNDPALGAAMADELHALYMTNAVPGATQHP